MCPRFVQIIPGLLRSRNELEEILDMVEEKRLKLMKYLITSWVVMGYGIVDVCGFVLTDGMKLSHYILMTHISVLNYKKDQSGFERVQEMSILNGSRHLHSVGTLEENEDILEMLLESVNERRSFIEELERLRGNLVAYKIKEKLKSLQNDDLVKVMELRKIVLQLRRQVHKEVDFYHSVNGRCSGGGLVLFGFWV
ncbi:hypothetical protein Tco_0407448 [Tanacetum coccineum]